MGKRIAIVLALVFALGTVNASATDSTWTRYHRVHGTSKVHTVKIRTTCISAEDSAAHLKLISYGNGVAVYGCSRDF